MMWYNKAEARAHARAAELTLVLQADACGSIVPFRLGLLASKAARLHGIIKP